MVKLKSAMKKNVSGTNTFTHKTRNNKLCKLWQKFCTKAVCIEV